MISYGQEVSNIFLYKCAEFDFLSQECHTSRECMLPSGLHGNMNKPSSKKAMDSELAESVRPKSLTLMNYL